MVDKSAISSAPNAWLCCFIPRVQANRMKSQCLLYLIVEMRRYAFWVVQAIGIGFVIVLVIHVSRKPTSMSMTKVENCCHLSNQKPHEEVQMIQKIISQSF